ncbi:MAG: ParB/RepB/Spo0J family partition protein [Desulfobacterales bacterium]|jgi:ParB-like chromosome segregation protein Spo0J|nr:ParB/RepB/Spo0J family partition protein [Desulfobacterales bacterium]
MASDDGRLEERPRVVRLRQIDPANDSFRITTRHRDERLELSLERIGLLTPPLVVSAADGLAIVSGFRRVEACRRLGWETIPARVLSEHTPAYACALRAVAENALARPLNLIETSRALTLLEQHAPGGRLPPGDAAALGLPAHAGLAAKLKPLCRMPPEVQEAVLEETVSFAMAGELGGMPAAAAAAFARLFRRLKTSLNKQREIVTLVVEIAAREGIDPCAVLGDPALAGIQGGEELDRNEQTRRIRRRLRQRRFPALLAAEEAFQALRRRLKLGDNLQLSPPRDFEGARFTLSLSFENLEELRSLRDKLDELAGHPDLHRLLTGKGTGFAGAPEP